MVQEHWINSNFKYSDKMTLNLLCIHLQVSKKKHQETKNPPLVN